MKKDEYKSLIERVKDPYAVWIREKEAKRGKAELTLPRGYSIFLDGDGDIDPGISEALNEYGAFSGAFDFIYTDEDETDKSGRRHDPCFKPAYSPHTIDSYYYPGGLTIVSDTLTEKAERESLLKPGSLLFLRECHKRAKKPLHIPEVLYHAGSHHDYAYKDSIPEPEEKDIPEETAVVILSKDHPELVSKCLGGLNKSSAKENIRLETVVIDNGSSAENTAEYEKLSKEFNFRYIREEQDFYYSVLCNKGVKETSAPVLLFLNDDIEVPEGTCFLREMISEAVRSDTGAVGCKLLYPGNKLIQHCGISLLKSGASHCLAGFDDSAVYCRNVNRIKRNVFAVTGACLMAERDKFERAGGFDEKLAVAYTDVDLCAAFLRNGLYNVSLNNVSLCHHESLSRKSDVSREKYDRLKAERTYFYEKNRDLLKNGDPWYNRNLTGTGLDLSVDTETLYDRIPFYRAGDSTEAGPDTKGFKTPDKGQVFHNLEIFEEKMSDANGHEDFYEISGWGFIKGRPGYECDIYALIDDNGKKRVLKCGHTPREDLAGVFPKERDTCLSGFSVKAERKFFETEITRDKITLIFCIKDFFGRDRGFIIHES